MRFSRPSGRIQGRLVALLALISVMAGLLITLMRRAGPSDAVAVAADDRNASPAGQDGNKETKKKQKR